MTHFPPSSSTPFPRYLGPYKLLSLIGQGGMGEIFLAEDHIFERKVALKKILPKLVSYELIKKRFLNEAKIAAQLAHPSIIPIYSLHMDHKQIYYTMPYIKGKTLKMILKKERESLRNPTKTFPSLEFSVPALMRIFLSVCQAIDYAHSNGFLHRDLKPENIMVGKFGEVMIFDWGIASRIKSREEIEEIDLPFPASFSDLTRPGKVVGTLNYMAPERAFGYPSSPQTDIYSLGVLLYQLLTLKLPFHRPSLKEFKRKIQKERWIDPKELASYRDIPLKLSSLAKRCIHPKPDHRPQSMREIITEIEEYIEGQPDWIPLHSLSPNRPSDWEFQEIVPLAKHVAISSLAGSIEWVMLMLSKHTYSGSTKISTFVELAFNSSGIGFLLCVPDFHKKPISEEGYLIWIGSSTHPGCKLLRKGVEVFSTPDHGLQPFQKYEIAIEKKESHLRLLINGQSIFDYMSHLPLIGGRVGILSRDASFKLDAFDLLLGSQSATVNCLAIPDAFLTAEDYDKALDEYRRIASSFPGRVEAREALFRAGITLLEKGEKTTDPKEKTALFEEAFEEFTKLYGTPGAPLEYLGKSMIYQAQGELEEEVKSLELGMRKYCSHPLLPLLEKQVSFRLHEAAFKERKATYFFLLLTLRYLPTTLESKETKQLIYKLTSTWENLCFLQPPPSFFCKDSEHLFLAISLAFWLVKPTVLYELIQKVHLSWPEKDLLLSNSLFALLEMGYAKLVFYFMDKLPFFSSTAPNILQRVLQFLLAIEDKPFSCQIEKALVQFTPQDQREKTLLFSYLFRKGEKRVHARAILDNKETLNRHFSPLPSLLFAALWEKKTALATTLLEAIPRAELLDQTSPYFSLYGCYLAQVKGEKAAKKHFFLEPNARYPLSTTLLSYYLSSPYQFETSYLPHAFSFEKRTFYHHLSLYLWSLGKEGEAFLYEKKEEKEFLSTQIPLDFI